MYQGRELSYVFDLIDACFMKLSSIISLPNFYSVIYYLCLIGIIYFLFVISKKFLNQKNQIITLLIISIFLATPAVFFSNYIFRTSKIIVALLILLIIYFLLKREKKYSLLFFFSILIPLFDRQGFFFLICLNIVYFILLLLKKRKQYLILVYVFACSILINIFYTYFLAPLLIKNAVGYFPDMSYLNIDLTDLIQKPHIIIDSLLFTLDSFVYFFGNIGRLPTVVILLPFLWLFRKNFAVLLSIFFIFILNTLMVLRHPWILWPETRIIYYIIPSFVLYALAVNMAAVAILKLWPKTEKFIIMFLLIVFVLNVLSLPRHFNTLKNGYFKLEYSLSPQILKCIREKNLQTNIFNLPSDMEGFCRNLRN